MEAQGDEVRREEKWGRLRKRQEANSHVSDFSETCSGEQWKMI